MPSSPLVSVVICTRNRPDLIGNAVRSVLDQDVAAFELNVIDQSDTDATERALAPFAGDDRLHYRHTTKVGLSGAYNAGIAASSADIIAFTDDDCEAPVDWLGSVVAAFDQHPRVDLLYGQVLMPEELRGHEGVVPEYHIRKAQVLGKETKFFVAGMGANFAARRTLLARIGGFDEALGGGGPLRSSQDFDLAFRTYRAGRSILLEPSVKVLHYGHRTNEQWPATLKAYGVGDGAFYMKHARCGDIYAATIFVRRVGRTVASIAYKRLRGRPASPNYALGMLQGARQSFRFRIDRRTRKYVLREAPLG